MDWKTVDDEELMNYGQMDNPEAKCEIVRRFDRFVYLTAQKNSFNETDLKDLYQAAWERIFRYLSTYPKSLPAVKWITLSASRACLDWLRQNNRQRAVIVYVEQDQPGSPKAYIEPISLNEPIHTDSDEELGDNTASATDIFIDVKRRLDREIIERALGRLPESQCTAVRLRWLMGASYEEIAQFMGRGENAVYQLVFKGIKNLAFELFNQMATALSKEELETQIDTLPDDAKEIMRLFAIEKISIGEIAEQRNIRRYEVHRRLFVSVSGLLRMHF